MWEHFLNVHDSDDPVFAAVFNGISCVIILIQNANDFLIFHVFVQCYELGSRYHDVFCNSFVKREHVLHILEFHLINFTAFIALGHNDAQLLFRVMLLMPNRLNAEQTKQNS
ncbi:hypothetical protein D3C78_952360 [compost metagenome]